MHKSKWVKRFGSLAREVATWSKDPRAQVGAVLTDMENRNIHLGYNGPAKGENDDKIYAMPAEMKNLYIIHAEVNAIESMVVAGYRGEARAYLTKAPCAWCGDKLVYCRNRGILIREVYMPAPTDYKSKWYKEQLSAIAHLQKRGVRVYFYTI